MTSVAKGGGGSFREVRERHLDLFRGNHRSKGPPPPKEGKAAKDRARRGRNEPKRTSWKTVGILHFPAHHDED